MKKYGVMGFLVVFLFVLGSLSTAPDTFCSTMDSPSFTNLTQMEEWNNNLYLGTFNDGIMTMTDNREVVEASILYPSFMSVLDNIEGVDVQALIAQMEGMYKCNWIGAEVLASGPASSQAPVPEPANILLLGIGLAGMAKFLMKYNI